MRNILIVLIISLGVLFVIGQFAEVQSIIETLQKGDWRYLLIAMSLIFLWLIIVAATFKFLFLALEMEEKLINLIFTIAAVNFVNIVTPTAGIGGLTVLISESQKPGNSSGKITIAGVLYILFDYASFFLILILGFIVLFRRNNITVVDITAAGLFIILATCVASMLYLGTRSPKRLGNTLAWMAKFINKILLPIRHKPYLHEERAYEFVREAAEGLAQMRKEPGHFIVPGILVLTNKLLLILVLFMVFLAFDVPYSIGTIIAAFSIANLFIIVSPSPSGVGFVESAMTLTLNSFYLPLSDAVVVALAYRGLTFWLPLLLGFISFRYIIRKKDNATEITIRV